MKTLDEQGAIITRPTKQESSFFLSKSLHEPTDNNSNLTNTAPAVSLPSNTPACPNYDTDISLLSEVIDSLEQFFATQLQNLTQLSPVKCTSKEINNNNESDILIESLQDTILILKKNLLIKKIPSTTCQQS